MTGERLGIEGAGDQEPKQEPTVVRPHLEAVSDLTIRNEFASRPGISDLTGEAMDTAPPPLAGYSKLDVFPIDNSAQQSTDQAQHQM